MNAPIFLLAFLDWAGTALFLRSLVPSCSSVCQLTRKRAVWYHLSLGQQYMSPGSAEGRKQGRGQTSGRGNSGKSPQGSPRWVSGAGIATGLSSVPLPGETGQAFKSRPLPAVMAASCPGARGKPGDLIERLEKGSLLLIPWCSGKEKINYPCSPSPAPAGHLGPALHR